MIKLFKLPKTLAIIPLLLLTSCSEVGLLSEKNSWIVNDISSIEDFFKVYVVLQVSIIIVGVILSLLLSKLGSIISLIIHFIWIVYERDYGFLNVLLLFGLFTIVSFLIRMIKGAIKPVT
ncbi:hypothetical protein MKD41_09745 [Lutibacter sp. A64]|uniref:hypothetical protein n=1 Tax=Lutibacter sp. A64 TaxID=2918526 RepID=UPI001F055F6C|nr:hypothetical protein [Lutibacter sp. A64]UMB52619.1 hypothetical protein MKD41_09745 [Lutibacter sp. A64]